MISWILIVFHSLLRLFLFVAGLGLIALGVVPQLGENAIIQVDTSISTDGISIGTVETTVFFVLVGLALLAAAVLWKIKIELPASRGLDQPGDRMSGIQPPSGLGGVKIEFSQDPNEKGRLE